MPTLDMDTASPVDGQQAIELKINVPPNNEAPSHVTAERMWVNATTYLPMRGYTHWSNGQQSVFAMTVARRHSPLIAQYVIGGHAAAWSALPPMRWRSRCAWCPGTIRGYPAAVLAVVGIFFTAAGTRSIFSGRSRGATCRGGSDDRPAPADIAFGWPAASFSS